MKGHRFLSRKLSIFAPLMLLLIGMVACGDDATPVPAPQIDVGAISSAVESAVAEAVAKIPAADAPQIDSAAIQAAVEAAVKAAAPEGASAADIEAMVQTAVSASTQPGVTSEDVAALVTKAISDATAAAPAALAASAIQDIVEKALVAQAAQAASEARVSYSEGEGAAPKKGIFVNARALAGKYGEAAKYGGTFLNVQFHNNDHNDIHQSSGVNAPLLGPIYNSLLMTNPYDWTQNIPDLAYAWELSDDLKQLTFHLQEGATWHDGVPFTSADVEWSLERIWNKGVYAGNETPGNFKAPMYVALMESDIETPDEHTVVLNLKGYSPVILKLLGGNYASIVPKHISETDVLNALKDDLNPTGTGPFRLSEKTTTTLWEYERNPNYFKPDTPFLDAIETHVIPDVTVRSTAVLTGRIYWNEPHVSSKIPFENAKAMAAQEPRLVWEPVANYIYRFFVLNTTRAPLDDLRVRQAFNETLQREEFTIEGLGEGRGAIGTALFPLGEWAMPSSEIEKLVGYGTDMEKRLANARALLAEYEAEKGEIDWSKVPFQCATNHISCDMTVIIQALMKDVGVDIKIEPNQTAQVWGKQVDGDYFMSVMNGAQDFDDPTDTFAKTMVTGADFGFHRFSNPEIDALYAKQVFMVDKEERKQVAWEIDRLAVDDSGFIILYWAVSELLTWEFVKGWRRNPSFWGQTDMRLEHVWLDLPDQTRDRM